MIEDGPVLDQLNVVVGTMRASADFYRLLGVDITVRGQPWDDHHREVGGGASVTLEFDSAAFAQHWCRGWTAARRGPVIGFRVRARETVDRLYAEVTNAGYRGLQTPYDTFWGARYAVVEDPDGNAVGLMSASDNARRTAPPDPSSIK
jgi:uncharacterized glyoxalase superfamily protein PhnB